jgi:hypothetical protein
VSMFHPHTHQTTLFDPQFAPDAKSQSQHDTSWHTFCGIHTGTPEHEKSTQMQKQKFGLT